MRAARHGLGLLLLVAVAACGSDDDGGDDDPRAGSSASGAANGGAAGGSGDTGRSAAGASSAGSGVAGNVAGAGAGGSSGSAGTAGNAGNGGVAGGTGAAGAGSGGAAACDSGAGCDANDSCTDCTGHGTCQGGSCECNQGYTGASCETCADGWHRAGDGVSCTQDRCDPNRCAAGLSCEPSTGVCCEALCTAGDTQCSAGAQRLCAADGLGCFKWLAPGSCGAPGCADDKTCAPLANGVTVEQWGSRLDDEIVAAEALAPGQVVLFGRTSDRIDGQTPAGSSDVFLTRRNAQRSYDWTHQIGSLSIDDAGDMVASSGGTTLITGDAPAKLDATDTTLSGLFLSRRAADGSQLWLARWGGVPASALGLAEDAAGNIFVVGRTEGDFAGPNAGNWDAIVSKLDEDGNELWSRQWGTMEHDVAIAVAADLAGNAYVTGYTVGDLDGNDSAGMADVFLVKLDPAGTKEWTRTLGSAGEDSGNSVLVDGSGEVLVTGLARDSLGGSGSGSAFLAKWGGAGVLRWVEQWGPVAAGAIEIVRDAGGAIFVAGTAAAAVDTATPVGGWDVFVSKWTQSGMNRQRDWSKQYGTLEDEVVDALAVGSDGMIFVAGNTPGSFPGYSNRGRTDAYLLRITP